MSSTAIAIGQVPLSRTAYSSIVSGLFLDRQRNGLGGRPGAKAHRPPRAYRGATSASDSRAGHPGANVALFAGFVLNPQLPCRRTDGALFVTFDDLVLSVLGGGA